MPNSRRRRRIRDPFILVVVLVVLVDPIVGFL
jgi:hypothetical protein